MRIPRLKTVRLKIVRLFELVTSGNFLNEIEAKSYDLAQGVANIAAVAKVDITYCEFDYQDVSEHRMTYDN